MLNQLIEPWSRVNILCQTEHGRLGKSAIIRPKGRIQGRGHGRNNIVGSGCSLVPRPLPAFQRCTLKSRRAHNCIFLFFTICEWDLWSSLWTEGHHPVASADHPQLLTWVGQRRSSTMGKETSPTPSHSVCGVMSRYNINQYILLHSCILGNRGGLLVINPSFISNKSLFL